MKKLLSVILAVLMIAASIPMTLVPASAASEGYNGTPLYPDLITEDNYETFGLKDKKFVDYFAIRNASELYGFAEYLKETRDYTANVVLLNDIIVNEDMDNPEYRWEPIEFYCGNLDGNGCTISGIWVDRGEYGYGGLFLAVGGSGLTKEYTISNLTIANSKIKADYSAGAIAGSLGGQGYTISNCRVESDVLIETRAGSVGGFFGEIDASFMVKFDRLNRFENCVMAGQVKSRNSYSTVAALVGRARIDGRETVEASNCYYVIDAIKGGSVNYNYAFGGRYSDYLTNKGVTKLSDLNGSHACINVSRVETAPTCVYEGVSAYTHCIYCGKVNSGADTTVKATGKHSMGDYVYNGDGTCYANGTKTKECIYHCGKSETVEAPDTITHGKMKTVYRIEATCKNAGHSTYEECTVCGHKVGYVAYDKLECNFEEFRTEPATCTRSGVITYRCTLCNEYKYEEIPALGHDLVMQDGKAPTCKERGYTSHAYCTRCDYKTEEYTEFYTVWHDYSVLVETKEPTCTGSGYTRYKCKWCDSTELRDRKPYLPHDYEWTLNEEESHCGQMPRYDGVCKDCGYTYYKFEGDVIEHNYVYESTTEPTCYKVGYNDYRCTKCSRVSYDVIPELDHDYSVERIIKDATCTTDGRVAYGCAHGCGSSIYKDIESLGHDLETTERIEPTCTTAGWTTGEKCSRCDYAVTAQKIPATGHTLNEEGKVLVEASCLPGLKEYYCSVCADTILEEIPATGEHVITSKVTVEATCADREVTEESCKNCDYLNIIIGDYADEHKEIKVRPGVEATCTSYGYTDETYCAYCYEVIDSSESIKPLGHKEKTVPEKAATCTEWGHSEYKVCERCDVTLQYPEQYTVLGHDYVYVPHVVATCSKDGTEPGYKCNRCDYVSGMDPYSNSTYHPVLHGEIVDEGDCNSYMKVHLWCDDCGYDETRENTAAGYGLHEYSENIEDRVFKKISDTQCGWACEECGYCAPEFIGEHYPYDSNGQPMAVSPYYHKGTYGNYTYHVDYKCAHCNEVYTQTIDKSEIGFDYQECDHICHKTGFMGFFAKIAIFFWKLFKTNPVCECGMAHY